MRKGLIIGKFMPPHSGHQALIQFAASRCDHLTVLVGALKQEPIPGPLRKHWMESAFQGNSRIVIDYTDEELPSAQESSRDVSQVWAGFLKKRYPEVSVIFSSEPYGDYLAEYWGIAHESFDPERTFQPVSATAIRQNPGRYWNEILETARPYFLKKICVFGPESTGKSVLTKRLAHEFETAFVPEMAREIIGDQDITPELFPSFLEAQAQEVLKAQQRARRFLFCDTDHRTTGIYGREFFHLDLTIPEWIEAAHQYDLYFFTDIDCPWIEDSQRFFKEERQRHRNLFLSELQNQNLEFEILSGDWNARFQRAKEVLNARYPF